jgi:tRNA A-37 threonylcarbamoyl transferase component Bud32
MPQVEPLRPDDPKRVGRYRLTGRITGIPSGSPAYLGRTTEGDRVTITLLAGERTADGAARDRFTADGAARDRFTAEARAARQVPPFCVARILDAGVEGVQAYLVSEYVPGPLLSEVVASDGPRGRAALEALAIGMATGLAAVHQAGLVHGEFGPGHVVLAVEGPRVIGFAITPPYGAATPAADMHAWARTVLFAATGRSPSSARDLEALREPLRGVVASCVAPEPATRPGARQVVVRLLGHDNPPAGVLAEGSRRAARAAMRAPAQPTISARHPSAARRRRSRSIGWVAAALVCVLAIVAAVRVLQHADASPRRASDSRPASGAASPSDSASTTPSPAPTLTLPASVAGTWSGSVRQGSDSIATDVKLSGNSPDGTITYSGTSFVCSGDLTLGASTGSVLKLNQQIVAGNCLNGVLTLTQEADGSLKFYFKGPSRVAATGTLTRK